MPAVPTRDRRQFQKAGSQPAPVQDDPPEVAASTPPAEPAEQSDDLPEPLDTVESTPLPKTYSRPVVPAVSEAPRLSDDPNERAQQSMASAESDFAAKQRAVNPFIYSGAVKSLAKTGGKKYMEKAVREGERDYSTQVQNDRAQAIAARRGEQDRIKAENAVREEQFRSTGQQFYTDPYGRIQPIQDPEGRALYHATPWEEGTHPKTGAPVLQKRDQFGQRQFKTPPIVASPDLTDDQLYYKFGDDDLRPAGKVEDLVNHPDFTIARTAKRAAAARKTAIWKEAIAPMEAVKADTEVAYEQGQQRAIELQSQIEQLTTQAAAFTPEVLGQTQGGFMGIGSSPTPAAAQAQQQKAALDNQIGALLTEQAQLHDSLKPMGQLGRTKRTAALDLAMFKAKAAHESYSDLADERRLILKHQGKSEADDPTLKSILEAQATYGTQLHRAASLSEREALDASRASRATPDVPVTPGAPAADTGDGTFTKTALSFDRGLTSEGIYAASEGTSRLFSQSPVQRGLHALEDWATEKIQGFPLSEQQKATRQKLRQQAEEKTGISTVNRFAKDYAQATADLRQQIRTALPVDQKFAQSKLGQISQGAGQLAGTTLMTVAGGSPAIAATSIGQIYDEGYQDAKNSGADDATAHETAMKYLPAASLDYLSDKLIVGKLLKPLVGKMTVGRFLKDIITSAAVEGGTEGIQQAYLNQIASKLQGYDPDRPFDKDVYDSVLVGAVLGAGATTLGTGSKALNTPSGEAPQAPKTASNKPVDPAATPAGNSPTTDKPIPPPSNPGIKPLTPEQFAAEEELQRRLNGSDLTPEEKAEFERLRNESESEGPIGPTPGPSTAEQAAEVFEPALAEKRNTPPPAKPAAESAEVFQQAASTEQQSAEELSRKEGVIQNLVDQISGGNDKTRTGLLNRRKGLTEDQFIEALQNVLIKQRPGRADVEQGVREEASRIANSPIDGETPGVENVGRIVPGELEAVADTISTEKAKKTAKAMAEVGGDEAYRPDVPEPEVKLRDEPPQRAAESARAMEEGLTEEDRLLRSRAGSNRLALDLQRQSSLSDAPINFDEAAVPQPAANEPARAAAEVPVSEPKQAAPDVPARAEVAPSVSEDRAEYDRLQAKLKSLGPEKFGTKEYNDIWQKSEDIKNRYKGMPPGEVSGESSSEKTTAPAKAETVTKSDEPAPKPAKKEVSDEKWDADLKAQNDARDKAMAARPPSEQDPDFWVRKQVERIALERGLSLQEARQDAKATLVKMASSALKHQIRNHRPIDVNAVGERYGVDSVPKGYVREGDMYVFKGASAGTSVSDVVKTRQSGEESARKESKWQRLMRASDKDVATIASEYSATEAKEAIDRLNAAPGDNPAARKALESRLAPKDTPAPVSATVTESTPESVEGDKINKKWTAFDKESGTLGVPRNEMPQIKSEARGALVNFLKARGIEAKAGMINPTKLKPTQAEFSPEKVQAAREFKGSERPLLISSDNHVVDGHHQWMAALDDTGSPMPVIKLNAPIDRVLAEMKEFPSTETTGGAQPKVAPKAESVAPAAKPLSERAIEALQKAKIDTRGKLYDVTAGAPVAAYNAALDIAILGIRAGRALADVIKLAVARFKAKHPKATSEEVAKLTAAINDAYANPPEPPGAKTAKSEVPKSLREGDVPANDIEYDVRNQDERMKEARAMVDKDGATTSEQNLSNRSLPADTRVAIGGILLEKKMNQLRDAKPEDAAKITADINRITSAVRSGVSTESGQGVAMHNRIYQNLGVMSAMEYTREVNKKRVEQMGGEDANKAATEVADVFNKTKDQAARDKAIEKLKERYTSKPVRKMLNSLQGLEVAQKLNELGVLRRDDLVDMAANELGLPGIDSSKLRNIADLVDKIEGAKDLAEAEKHQLELADTLANFKGTSKIDLETSLMTLNVLLSANTQIANAGGNAVRLMTELSSVAGTNPRQALDMWQGFKDGLPLGWSQAKSIWETGRSTRDLQDKTIGVGSAVERADYKELYPNMPKAIATALNAKKDVLARVGRFMRAMDALAYYPAREAYARMSVAQQLLKDGLKGAELRQRASEILHTTPDQLAAAKEQARKEGYTGISLDRRASEIVEARRGLTPEGEAAAKQAESFAADTTYTNEPVGNAGVIYRAAANVANKVRLGGVPVLKPWMMFLRTPTNMFNASLDYTPVGAARALKGSIIDQTGTRKDFTQDEINRKYFQASIGTSLMAGATLAIAKGLMDVTFKGPQDPEKRRQLMTSGWRPFSFRIGDGPYMSYRDTPMIVPLAVVGYVADAAKYNKDKKSQFLESRVADALLNAPYEAAFATSPLTGMADLLGAANGQGNLARGLTSVPTNVAIPGARLLMEMDRYLDPKTYDSNPIKQTVPFLRRDGIERSDIEGRPVKVRPSDRFVGFPTNDPLDKLLNDRGLTIPGVSLDLKLGKQFKDRAMTDEEREAYKRVSGQRIRARLQAISPRLSALPTDEAQDEIERITREERARVKPLIGVTIKK